MSLSGLRLGKMDIKLSFEIPVYTRNSNGEDVISSWYIYKTCYAERTKKPGNEVIQANQEVAIEPTDYKIRYDTSIVATMRCFEGEYTGSNPRLYVRFCHHLRREGYTIVKTEARDNA